MTYGQCFAARRLLGIGQGEVAKAIGVGRSAISEFETGGHLKRTRTGQDRLPMLRAFFERAGVEFINGDEPGVKLRKVD